jgi:phage terminase small subunit
MNMTLEQRQARRERFCRELLLKPRIREAAIAAGFPPASASVRGNELLHRPDVAARLVDLITEQSRTASASETIRLAAVARKLLAR